MQREETLTKKKILLSRNLTIARQENIHHYTGLVTKDIWKSSGFFSNKDYRQLCMICMVILQFIKRLQVETMRFSNVSSLMESMLKKVMLESTHLWCWLLKRKRDLWLLKLWARSLVGEQSAGIQLLISKTSVTIVRFAPTSIVINAQVAIGFMNTKIQGQRTDQSANVMSVPTKFINTRIHLTRQSKHMSSLLLIKPLEVFVMQKSTLMPSFLNRAKPSIWN